MPFTKTDAGTVFEFRDGPFRASRWTVAASVCQDLTCSCHLLTMHFVADGTTPAVAGRQWRISLDMGSRKSGSTVSVADFKFADTVRDDLDAGDWSFLEALFNGLKQQVYAGLDLTQQQVRFKVAAIENTALMVAYNEKFPFHNRIRFDVDGHTYVGVDFHCVRPDCPCWTVHVAFAYLSPGQSDGLLNGTEEFVVGMDLEKQTWSLLETRVTPTVPVATVVNAFLGRYGYALLVERRRVLRVLYEKCRGSTRATASVRTTPTVGRNEPCPCGSGKKYKKCCGR
ncbi:MAG: hypothetical protein A3K19_32130 [Lentisphaerae bacterium RIFOXYB12_FULL_65_16]|nr:MAG: hypothetical protein A3K18_10910 [Lentisphaerae bacterium RIFOXYA12_64_32]OGV88750.1 MAG: hypothetical protein A3K19_32130 [Lentisphaerae bacterium RIFOXYB12_FULL_65_16]